VLNKQTKKLKVFSSIAFRFIQRIKNYSLGEPSGR